MNDIMAARREEGLASTKTRRSHRKSRNGCSECKRRHIRCDEGRPTCTNCAIAERQCSFPGPPPPPASSSASTPVSSQPQRYSPGARSASVSSGRSGSRGPGEGVVDASTPRSAPLPPAPQLPAQHPPPILPSFNESFAGTPPSGASTFSPQHLMLLHHAERGMEGAMMGHGQTSYIIEVAVMHAIDCPYLIDQVLAFSAMHLAFERPEATATFRHQATELQTRAVAYFSRETEVLKANELENPVQRFLFAAILSLHVLAETLAYHRADFHYFIDRFIECIHLHRGVRAVIKPTWETLLRSELEPILRLSRIDKPNGTQHGTECAPLLPLLETSDLNAPSLEACREAASWLQWAFDLNRRLPSDDIPHAVSGFIVLVPGEFIGVLRRHRPEALVILAYYGVLLHRTRRYWICGGNGAFMIRSISQHLGGPGGFWGEALRWPLQVLDEDRD